MKSAVLLLNLGSPDKPETAEVREYLAEFLGDERVIDVPFVRKFVVPQIILRTRPAKSAEAYRTVWTDEGSPLLVTSYKQQEKLQAQIEPTVYLAMRYGKPSTKAVLQDIVADGITHLYVLPLYPHYAMSSYETAYVAVTDALAEMGATDKIHITLQQPFYNDPDYIAALVEVSKPYLEKDDWDHLLFSYHGIPVRHLEVSDPSNAHCNKYADCCERCHPAHATCYKHQCTTTTKLFTKAAGLRDDQWSISFQSRLGKEPWIPPYTDLTLEQYPKKGIKRLKVMCPAFITDCLETLEEIRIGGREIFEEHGGEQYEQIPCLNDQQPWIDWMTKRVNAWQESLNADNTVVAL